MDAVMFNSSAEPEPWQNSSWPGNSTGDDAIRLQKPSGFVPGQLLTLGFLLLNSFAIAIACASGCLNVLLLIAIARVKRSTLRAKRLIQNNAIANIMLPAITALNLIYVIGGPVIQFCLKGVFLSVFSVATFVHAFCCIGLTLDRLYAVVRPLGYHTVGYPQWVRVTMAVMPWVVAILIWGVVALVSLTHLPPPDGLTPRACMFVSLTFDTIWSTNLMDIFLLSFNTLSFLIYIFVFAWLKYQKTRMEQKSETSTNTSRKSLPLAVAYFLMTITTVCLFVPTPIYSLLYRPDQIVFDPKSSEVFLTTIKGLVILNLCNSCLDPLILIFRVPAIRQNLPVKSRR